MAGKVEEYKRVFRNGECHISCREDVSRGGTSTTPRTVFHTDDVNQCLQFTVVMVFQVQIFSVLC